ncbi:MAG: thioesterase-like protein [Sphaerospermopsis sp. SIO1G2]|nr:thioesterase-like protein [Sphaerospermopsis sp. SIO1G2]
MSLPSFPITVKPEWLDYNGHMNVGYYVVAFDMATDMLYEQLGIGEAYLQRGFSVYTLGMNVDYLHELFAGEQATVTTQLLDWDHKRVHYVHLMHHAESGKLVSVNECLGMNVNLETKRSALFPDDVQASLQEMFEAHQTVPFPEQVGRKLGIRR